MTTLRLEPTNPPAPMQPPVPRGRLMTAAQVAHDLFADTVSAKWVRRTVPFKLTLGHSTTRWYENDVRGWLEQRRAE